MFTADCVHVSSKRESVIRSVRMDNKWTTNWQKVSVEADCKKTRKKTGCVFTNPGRKHSKLRTDCAKTLEWRCAERSYQSDNEQRCVMLQMTDISGESRQRRQLRLKSAGRWWPDLTWPDLPVPPRHKTLSLWQSFWSWLCERKLSVAVFNHSNYGLYLHNDSQPYA